MTDETATEDEAEAGGGWLSRLKRGLSRSSSKIGSGITGLFTKRKLDEETLEAFEELLISADLGVPMAARMAEALAHERFAENAGPEEVKRVLAKEIAAVLEPVAQTISIRDTAKPHVILFCGVNGSGKTTTIAKFAALFHKLGLKVFLVAGDTFRAAAIEQLQIWGDRVGVPVIQRQFGADASGLAYAALEWAKSERADILMIDTAGRLQNKAGLMAELQKIVRVLKKLDPQAPHDCILVLDATVGQNAHNQVEVFREMVDITGLVVTKLDGSAKGGVVVALAERFKLPIYAIGVGESLKDMRAFEAKAFARSLVGLDG
jgi:fused signal recognition particle receptor